MSEVWEVKDVLREIQADPPQVRNAALADLGASMHARGYTTKDGGKREN